MTPVMKKGAEAPNSIFGLCRGVLIGRVGQNAVNRRPVQSEPFGDLGGTQSLRGEPGNLALRHGSIPDAVEPSRPKLDILCRVADRLMPKMQLDLAEVTPLVRQREARRMA
jgi:hypothetical protein